MAFNAPFLRKGRENMFLVPWRRPRERARWLPMAPGAAEKRESEPLPSGFYQKCDRDFINDYCPTGFAHTRVLSHVRSTKVQCHTSMLYEIQYLGV